MDAGQETLEFRDTRRYERCVACVAFTEDSSCIASGMWDHTAGVHTLDPGGAEWKHIVLKGHSNSVNCVAIDKEVPCFAFVSDDGTV